jgi:hypothetical protein
MLVNNNVVATGGSSTVNLNTGSNTIVVTCIAPNGVTTTNYVIVVTA